MPATTTYPCPDGTPFHVQWVRPGDENDNWGLNNEHNPKPWSPMGVALEDAGRPGHARCYTEADVEPLPVFRYSLFVNGYQYRLRAPATPEILAGYAAFRAAHGGGIRGPWDEFCEPRMRQAVADIAASAPDARVVDLAVVYLYGWHQTFTASGAFRGSILGLIQPLAEAYGPQAMLVAQELAQGGANATLAIDEEIEALAEMVRSDRRIAAALDAPGWPAFRERAQGDSGGTAFVERLDEFLGRHALRSTSWDLMDPTWGERPETVLDLIRSLARQETGSPVERAQQSSAKQAVRLAELGEKLPPEKLEQARRLVSELDGYVHVREGRAYWQMTIAGAMRHALLRIGGRLKDAGAIDEADDIFFLLPEEADAAQPGDLRVVAASRRAEWERWRAITPPDFVGAPPAVAPGVPPAAIAGELRGLAASRGKVTARARIVSDSLDVHLLGDGEVLVCVMTTPAWTPMFAIAGAVVTETGTPESHPAIASREYGIPCVVGVRGATKLIPDGAMVEVDGEAGTVRVLA